ncbi:MAG: dicarboxylate/amino acid:cation symporter [Gammaproteobacteria bacterium]|nr:dicarboxylate/amino acid:cation symporter [Gammaproteobacteria bacterium]NNC98327.1 dicarboxylate/amino acid:cation symporter [Gammaproteobacteria bacterium]NNM14414.1 dicarboxylate/amino acid:cation symporter [Gammaproteobacteria bacterium]
MMSLQLHWQIMIALALAAVVGIFSHGPEAIQFISKDTAIGGVTILSVFEFIGKIFLNALKMLIVPLIVSSIIVGVAGIGTAENLGRLGGRTLLFYAGTTLAAILVGLLLVNLVNPGVENGEPVKDKLALAEYADEAKGKVGEKGAGDVVEIFVRMVPPNIVKAAAEGQMLGLIVFSLLFGFFMTHLPHENAEPLYRFWDGVFKVMMSMTEFIMAWAPVGVFGLVAAVILKTGFDAGRSLLIFAITVVIALAIHVLVTLPILLKKLGKVNPWRFYRAISPAMLTSFSTASSSATLPITMDCIENNVGVSNKISSFVLPLGATVNMNGTALYECMAAMFIAQAFGIDLGFGTQFTIVVVALMTSIGVAGIPSASLVAIAVILVAVGLPIEAVGVLFVFDRVLDMLRTSVNVIGDATCATIIAALENEPLFDEREAFQEPQVAKT